MITEKDLLEEIEECQTQPITDKKFERLASCFIVYDHLFGSPQDAGYSYAESKQAVISTDCGTEFLQAVDGKNSEKVWGIVGELMEVVKALHPKMYDHALDKIYDL